MQCSSFTTALQQRINDHPVCLCNNPWWGAADRTCQLDFTEFLKLSAAASLTDSSKVSIPTIYMAMGSSLTSFVYDAVVSSIRTPDTEAINEPPKCAKHIQVMSTVASTLPLPRLKRPVSHLETCNQGSTSVAIAAEILKKRNTPCLAEKRMFESILSAPKLSHSWFPRR